MKLFLKPKLALLLLAVAAAHSAQAQDTLKVTLQEAVRIALSENPTIKSSWSRNQIKEGSPSGSLFRSVSRSQFSG